MDANHTFSGFLRLLLFDVVFILIIKGELKQELHPCFYVRFLLIVWRRSLVESFGRLGQIPRSYKLQGSEFSASEVFPANVKNMSPLVLLAYFVSFM